MNRKKPNKLVEFLNGKGFYIILILCIAAVGISGYVLFFSGNETSGDDFMASRPSPAAASPTVRPSVSPSSEPLTTAIPDGAIRPPEVVMSNPSAEPTAAPTAEATPSGSDAPGGAVEVAGPADLDEDPKVPTAAFFVWPVNGEVRVPFSIDELVFSNTMEDWRVHTGADISGSLGTLVNAIGAGIVDDIYDDEMMGNTVVINHGNETYSVYRNLAETLKVSIGDTVSAGQVIGAIGETAEMESAETPHLHLEVIRSGAQIDPLDILP